MLSFPQSRCWSSNLNYEQTGLCKTHRSRNPLLDLQRRVHFAGADSMRCNESKHVLKTINTYHHSNEMHGPAIKCKINSTSGECECWCRRLVDTRLPECGAFDPPPSSKRARAEPGRGPGPIGDLAVCSLGLGATEGNAADDAKELRSTDVRSAAARGGGRAMSPGRAVSCGARGASRLPANGLSRNGKKRGS